ncbi:MAG: tRNA (adenosine(37)-N6)-dimethylallyltransferase MiaA [Pseudomonadota bacterium]
MPDKIPETIVLIAGPTASGKSALAVALARAIGADVINADAIQVYEDLEILSARPSAAEMGGVRHHLFGVLGAGERCSAGRWAAMAADALGAIAAEGRAAIFVGGTGLYFRVLTEGLSEIPPIPDDVRDAARARRAALGAAAFHKEVTAGDPAMARLDPADTHRNLRAWEVLTATGRPLSDFQSQKGAPLTPAPAARVILAPDRAALYARCEARFDAMMAAGALDEAARLKARGVEADMPVMKALGLAELIRHLNGSMSLEAAIEEAKRNTRRFAKRQLTWFRNQTPDWPVAEDSDAAMILLREKGLV